MRQTLFLLLCFYCHLAYATSSVYDYDIKHWTSADGLSSNSVRAITRDQQGYIWFGTLYGLNRFDGKQFDIFTTELYPTLASNTITQLLTDSEGLIWIGTKAGLSLLNPSTLQVERLPIFSEVTSLLEVAPGEVWVTADQLFKVSAGKVSRVEHIKSVVSQLAHTDEHLWVSGSEFLYQRDRAGEWLQFALPPELAQNPIYDLTWTSSGLLIASEVGLYRLQPNGLITLQLLPDNSTAPVYRILEDQSGAMWLSSYRKLFYQFPQQPWQVVTSTELGSVPWFSYLFQDHEYNIWLSSFSDGVYLASRSQIKRTLPGLEPVIRSVSLHPQGQLLFASQRAVGILDSDGTYRPYINEALLKDQTVHDLYWRDNQHLWLGLDRGLFEYNSTENVLTPVFSELAGQIVRVVQAASDGGVWVGALHGLYHIKPADPNDEMSTATLTHLPINVELESRQITSLTQNQYQLFFGTTRGFYRLQENKLTRLGIGSPLYNAYILAAQLLQDGTIMVSTLDDGIFIQMPGQAWSRLDSGNGLRHGPAFSFYEHHQSGWIWISTHKGIVRLWRDSIKQAATAGFRIEEVLSPYDRQMGSFSSRCCNGAGQAKVVHWQAQLWYPTLRGLVAVPELVNTAAQRELNPLIKQVSAQQQYVIAALQPRQVLAEHERNITINYAAFEFNRPDSVEFRYQLSGFDDDWHKVGTRRQAVYTNLPPGQFVFQLEAKYVHQTWQEAQQATLDVVIPRAFHETLLYRLLWLLLVVCVLYAAFWLYRKNALSKQEQLARLVQQRTQELENTNLKLNELNEQLSQLTHRDTTTGLRNLRFMQEQLPKDIEHFQRNRQALLQQGKTIALVLLELDDHDSVLQEYGSKTADSVLQQVGALLSRETRGSDYVVRYSASRFILVFRDISVNQVSQYGRRLVEQLAATEFNLLEGNSLTCHVSAGYALYPLPLLGGQLLSWEVSIELAALALAQLHEKGLTNKVATLQFDQQVDAFEFEESRELAEQINRLITEGLITLEHS